MRRKIKREEWASAGGGEEGIGSHRGESNSGPGGRRLCAPAVPHLGAHREGQPLVRADLGQTADAVPRGAEGEGLQGFSLVRGSPGPKSFL